MHEYSALPHRKVYLAIFVIFSFFLTVFYYDSALLGYSTVIPAREIVFVEDNFLVSSSKCKIIDIDPFSKDAKKYFRPEPYKSCRKLELLTYVTKHDNIATLHIDNEMAPSYSSSGVSCCYSNVTRQNHTDAKIIISSCQTFQDNITLSHDPVMVKCKKANILKTEVYENVHVAITPTESVEKKMNKLNYNNTRRSPSILFVGIDSISRLNLIRSLPNTYAYLESNGWISLKGYNKIEDNTFPNLMAILTGFDNTKAYNVCNPMKEGKLDRCPLLWYEYRKRGFITGYAEDEGSINTFNYLKKGFQVPPADYYFRPYVLASERLKTVRKDGMTYCTGPETAGERIMNIAKEFAVTFKNYPSFGFFWMNSFSHNRFNSPSVMDMKVESFLEELYFDDVTESSIIIFLSDHGMRFGDIRLTDTGWLEERLPFIYVSFPKWFREKFSREYNNFKSNANKLTCPYDLHMTLKHILTLSGYQIAMSPADACPKCKSLFEEIESERSCEDAGIRQHWCTCTSYKTTVLDKDVETNVTKFLLDNIASIIREKKGDDLCAKFSVKEVVKAKISQQLTYKNETYLLLKFKTKPEAVFEATIVFTGDIRNRSFSLSGDISRLDVYKKHSECVKDAYLKKYCYCR